MALFWCLFMSVCAAVSGFNVDTASRVVHRGNPDSMFGFTVQAHVDGGEKMLLVGAPEDDTGRWQDVKKPGSVYRCDPNIPNDCTEMIFDHSRGNNVDKQSRQIDQKSNQWFGATLTSTGLNGPIVACAPRYVTFVSSKLNQRDPVGSCFVAKTSRSSEINEFSPCRIPTHGLRKTGVCQAGFSAAISKDGERLFMGAPGSWYWQGRTFSLDPNEKFFYYMPRIPEEGQLLSQSLQKNPVLISTHEANARFDDSYMGYSITVGDFAGQAIQGVAVGVPRGANLRGLVVIYTWELQNIKNITGSQIGAYFGYCMASGDIDGDGFDDLIVGAPMFTKTKSDGYEHGRVYVIYQDRSRTFSRNHARTGEVSKGRFGLSVTSLGDINLDGFGDFAVGAPYGGKDGRGMVFIYHGSAQGVSEKYSQAIAAMDVDSSITTFGFSLSGGVDLDNNNYTDLAVGAYKSDSVVFFRSRPVVKVMAEFKFVGDSKLISLEEKKCTLRNGTRVACAQLIFCLTYDGINVDEQIKFEVTLDLDSKQKTSKRLFLMEGRTSVYKAKIHLVRGRQECRDVTVYLDEEIRDKLTPLEVAMSYDLITQRTPGVIPPVLDQTINNVYTDSLNIQKNCGPDNVCVPDLQMVVTTTNVNYILGSNENVNITVDVNNRGEDAFEAAYHLRMPPGVTYAKMKRLDDTSEEVTPVYCSISSRDPGGNSTLKCDMGNPLPAGQRVKFQVVLEVEANVKALDFDMEVNSTNPEVDTQYDNKRHLSIGVLVKAKLTIIGTSDPPELHYNASLYETEDVKEDTKLGPQVIHKYNIKNDGPFAVEQAEVYIMWPYQTLNGDNLMYMLIQPQVVGRLKCDVARNINPEAMFVKNPYNYYLQKEWEVYESSEFGSGKTGDDYLSVNGQNQYWQQTVGGENEQGSFVHKLERGTGGNKYNQEGRHYGEESGNVGTSEVMYKQNQTFGSQTGSRHGSYGQGSYGQSQGSYGQSQGSYGQSQGSYGQGLGNYGQAGSGRATGGITREWNKTTVYDEHGNIVTETESSTQYGGLGHEGEAGSSFSNRYGGSGVYNENSHNYRQSTNQNQQGSSHTNQDKWLHRFDASSNNNEPRHSWSTEESINKDIMNAGSSVNHNGNARGSSSVTVVGDGDDEISGFGAHAALNPNNEFRVGYADLGISGSESGSQRTQGVGAQGYGGAAQGGGTYGSSYSRSGSGGGSSYSYSSSSGSSQSGGQHYSYNARAHGGNTDAQSAREATRRRRQDDVDPELKSMLEKCEEKYKCEVIRCTTGYLFKGQEVWVALRSRINASVLNEISEDRAVKLSTLATTRVIRLPIVGKPRDSRWQTVEAQTVITPQLEAPSSGSIPLWVVVLAAVIGALLLLLLIFALYKCGFFKRNRPSDHAERQPLNGRDEHL